MKGTKNLSLKQIETVLLREGFSPETVKEMIEQERYARALEKDAKARKMTEACLREMGL